MKIPIVRVVWMCCTPQARKADACSFLPQKDAAVRRQYETSAQMLNWFFLSLFSRHIWSYPVWKLFYKLCLLCIIFSVIKPVFIRDASQDITESWNPTINLTYPSLKHVPKCQIHTSLKYVTSPSGVLEVV